MDADSEGLVLLTNDGDLANALTHPRYEHEKEYRVLVEGEPSESTLKAWRRGVLLEGEKTAPAEVEVTGGERGQTWLRIIMHEGRKRQIREVGGMLGHRVKYLQRVRIGPIRLGTMKLGDWRYLSASEVKLLLALVAPDAPRRPSKKRVSRPSRAAQSARPAKNIGFGKNTRPTKSQRPSKSARPPRFLRSTPQRSGVGKNLGGLFN